MRKSDLSNFYTNLLVGDVPVALQRRILNYARSHKEVSLLTALTAYDRLDPAIDAELASEPNAKVRMAWIRRPNRTAEEIVSSITREKRVTVLTVIAATDEELPDSVFKAIVDEAEAGGSSMLALTVAANKSAPDKQRARAAVVFARTCRAMRRNEQVLMPAVMEFADLMARNVRTDALAHFLASCADISAAGVTNLTNILTTVPASGSYEYGIVNSLTQLLEQAMIDVACATRIKATAEKAKQDMSRSRYYSYSAGAFDEVIKRAKVVIDAGGGSGTPATQLAVTDDAERIDAAIADMANRRAARIDANFLALLGNPNLSDEQFARMISSSASMISWNVMRAIPDILANQPERLAVFMVTNPHYVDDDILERLPNPAAMLSSLVDLVSASKHTAPWVLERLVNSRFFTSEVALRMPISVFRGPHLDANAVAKVIGFLEPIVTDDEVWHTFEMLAPEFEGSVEDLLNASRSL